ncbi:hypothetical protein [Chitinophaga hostae]|uniref:Uncharacterized protein n=1 Tax=Chitinophaga hostae TaxID=2831022 RepID=A0ABS5IVW0_9BACT|nr:hypothetical protein [Chitinophaga hostae]MBS0027086.1 hypothetical protein [Chitinophaga hostae]
MKSSFQIEINQGSLKTFFPEERIKDKYKIIEILLEACRTLLYSPKAEKIRAKTKIIVNIDKMNRLFFVSELKIYSIAFPFNISYDENNTSISYKNIIDIDSLAITNVLSIIKNPIFNSEHCLESVEPIIDIEAEHKINYWTLIRELILLEDGYIRYDKDEKGYQAALEKMQQHRHPLNHIDIFYTNHVSFKLGLEKEYLEADLIDTLDSNTDCKYLKIAVDSSSASKKTKRK